MSDFEDFSKEKVVTISGLYLLIILIFIIDVIIGNNIEFIVNNIFIPSGVILIVIGIVILIKIMKDEQFYSEIWESFNLVFDRIRCILKLHRFEKITYRNENGVIYLYDNICQHCGFSYKKYIERIDNWKDRMEKTMRTKR